MAGKTLRLQELLTVTSNTAQASNNALDLQAFSQVTVQLNVLAGSGTGYLVLEHAAKQESASFQPLQYFHIDGARTEVEVYSGTLRFLRWSTKDFADTPSVTFVIDVVARC